MAEFTKLGKGKVVCGQTKEVVINVYNYIKSARETTDESLALINKVSLESGQAERALLNVYNYFKNLRETTNAKTDHTEKVLLNVYNYIKKLRETMDEKLRHENLVCLLEVFKRRKRFYLVFEYMERTILEELEAAGGGLPDETVRRHTFQLIKAVDHCHANNIIHRDVKPENVLVSRLGVIKLCDFGFARATAPGEPYTEYVATRWYRAPELLVGDPKYGPEVDVWAIGCLFAEMMTGEPLFPGESDIDQLHLIVKLIGRLSPRQQQFLGRRRASLTENGSTAGGGTGRSLRRLLPSRRAPALALLAATLRPEPSRRPPCRDLLRHVYFTHDGFADHFPSEIRRRAHQEAQSNPLLRKWQGVSAGRGRRENINPEESNPEPPIPSLLINNNENSLLLERLRPPSKTIDQNSIGSAEHSGEERHADPPPSPAGPPSTPVNSRQPLQPIRRLPQLSPNSKTNQRMTLHATINALPVPIHNYQKTNSNKRSELRNELSFTEDFRNGRGWEASQPLKGRSTRPNQDLILPSVPGATFSPLKSSKIKLLPIENPHNIQAFRRDSDSNSSWNRVTPTSLPYM